MRTEDLAGEYSFHHTAPPFTVPLDVELAHILAIEDPSAKYIPHFAE